jgi:hypothetical protein
MFPTPSPTAPAAAAQFPACFRPVVGLLPASESVAIQCRVPLGVVVSPGLVSDVPVIDCTSLRNAIRCKTCAAYFCPGAEVDALAGTWRCPICRGENASPSELAGIPLSSRPEFANSVYDCIAPDCYHQIESCPVFVFALDVSASSFSCGLLPQMVTTIKSCIGSIRHARVGLVTMSDHLTLFDLSRRTQIVFGDLNEMPLCVRFDSVCPYVPDCESAFTDALDHILSQPPATGHCIGTAFLLLRELLSKTGGIVIISATGLPLHGSYTLSRRPAPPDEAELLMVRLPEDGSGNVFRTAALKLNNAAVSVHLFAAGTDYLDISTIAVPSGLTCGSCNYCHDFDATARASLHLRVFETLSATYFWDASLRMRTSPGIKVVRPHTNCALKHELLVSFPVMRLDTTIAFEFCIEGALDRPVFFQVGCVFSTAERVRMIRVLTFSIGVAANAQLI